MMLPTIHLNGTSRSELFDTHVSAIVAVDGAIAALRRAAPNSRDYYPQGPEAYPLARDEHLARLAALDKISRELHILAENVV